MLMIETYTLKNSHLGAIKKLDKEGIRLDVDDQLFYDFLKNEMDALLRQPRSGSITKITSYSKAWRMPLI